MVPPLLFVRRILKFTLSYLSPVFTSYFYCMLPDQKRLAKIIWNYLKLDHNPRQADCILVLGCHDLRVAERGAELFLSGYAPMLMISGGLGRLTKQMWSESEADIFSKIAIKKGVPKESIVIENRSRNTGENITFSYELLKNKGIIPERIILVQKPYMERRVYAAFKKQWPVSTTEIFVTSPQIPFEKYPTESMTMEQMTDIMVGDLQRMIIYPAKGYQIHQNIPPVVLDAYNKLIAAGFVNSLFKKAP
jgi:uncharacterized SAM-binding protein YcdF (DUF218 family)